MMHSLTPGDVITWGERLWRLILALFVLSLSYGMAEALYLSPEDYQQGSAVRMMYVHVPAAWMALFIYALIAGFSAARLIWKNPLCDILAKSAAPIGAVFTLMTLITGSLWGKPIWGTWWVWDARLTSVLILFFLYLGYIAIWDAFERREQAAKAAALIGVIGAVNLPIIKFSVEWWNTLHQPASVLKLSGPSIHAEMLRPLLLMWIAYGSFFLLVWWMRLKSEVLERKQMRQRLKTLSESR